jgi:hypothetical protein
MIRDFFIQEQDGTFPIPEAGLNSMNLSFFLNSSSIRGRSGDDEFGKLGNVEVGEIEANSGYSIMRTTKQISCVVRATFSFASCCFTLYSPFSVYCAL